MLLTLVFTVQKSPAAGPFTIYVANYPLQYFAERIGGDQVKVVFPAPADVDPAYWHPNVAEISAYQKADLILLNGAGYAKWVNKVSLPRSKMANTSRQFKDRYITTKAFMTHSHGAQGEHAHESLAFTIWLDLQLAVQQAEAITRVLSLIQPEQKEAFKRNYESLKEDLLALDQKILTIVSRAQSTPLLASHPVYDYFVQRYGLNLVSVHWEPDEVPGGDQWRELRRILTRHPAKWMIWEGAPVQATVGGLKTFGVNSLVFNPCGNVPEKGNFLSVMDRNAENLCAAFKK
jgi:zinc transport system substrate-binding protein